MTQQFQIEHFQPTEFKTVDHSESVTFACGIMGITLFC